MIAPAHSVARTATHTGNEKGETSIRARNAMKDGNRLRERTEKPGRQSVKVAKDERTSMTRKDDGNLLEEEQRGRRPPTNSPNGDTPEIPVGGRNIGSTLAEELITTLGEEAEEIHGSSLST